jgi:arginyl-tRNA synthetase
MELTAEQLKDIISTVIAESRKPLPPTEEQLAELASNQAMRLQQRDLVLIKEQNKRTAQRLCSHMRRNGTTTGVYVANGNYIICQQEQCIIRPGVAPAGDPGNDIYDTHLFNTLFQLAQDPTVF